MGQGRENRALWSPTRISRCPILLPARELPPWLEQGLQGAGAHNPESQEYPQVSLGSSKDRLPVLTWQRLTWPSGPHPGWLWADGQTSGTQASRQEIKFPGMRAHEWEDSGPTLLRKEDGKRTPQRCKVTPRLMGVSPDITAKNTGFRSTEHRGQERSSPVIYLLLELGLLVTCSF